MKVSELLEYHATEQDKANGLDLADFLTKTEAGTGIAMSDLGYPISWDIPQTPDSGKLDF